MNHAKTDAGGHKEGKKEGKPETVRMPLSGMKNNFPYIQFLLADTSFWASHCRSHGDGGRGSSLFQMISFQAGGGIAALSGPPIAGLLEDISAQ